MCWTLRCLPFKGSIRIAKTVSHTPHGFNQFGMFFQFLSQCPNMHVNGSLQNQGIISQSSINQLGSRENTARLSDQRFE